MSGEERAKKTIVEIIKMYSPRPTSGYDNSWIKDAMQAYADQQNAALKAALSELIPIAERHVYMHGNDYSVVDRKSAIDRANELLNKTE